MENIVDFLEQFFITEAKMATLKRVPNIENFNTALNEYFNFLVPQLRGATGHMPLTKLDDEDVYMMLEGLPDDRPRLLFKISQYSHEKYGTVWVAYVSNSNPLDGPKFWHTALFIVNEGGLKIGRYMLWTNYTDRGDKDAPFAWDEMWGYHDLNFETIVGPVDILRVQGPSEENGGLEQYNADI